MESRALARTAVRLLALALGVAGAGAQAPAPGEVFVDPRDDRVWLTNFATDALFVFEPRTGRLRGQGTSPHNTYALALHRPSGTLLASANPL